MAIANEIGDIAAKAMELAKGGGGRVLNSGRAIFSDATDDAVKNSRGLLGTIARMSHGEKDVSQALKGAFTQGTKNPGTDINWGTVAGSYIGAAAGYRALSGGGVYRDKNGNTNLIGVPFV